MKFWNHPDLRTVGKVRVDSFHQLRWILPLIEEPETFSESDLANNIKLKLVTTDEIPRNIGTNDKDQRKLYYLQTDQVE